MSKTVADASRDYRNKQREKLRRYEAALKVIQTAHLTHQDTERGAGYDAAITLCKSVAIAALQD